MLNTLYNHFYTILSKFSAILTVFWLSIRILLAVKYIPIESTQDSTSLPFVRLNTISGFYESILEWAVKTDCCGTSGAARGTVVSSGASGKTNCYRMIGFYWSTNRSCSDY